MPRISSLDIFVIEKTRDLVERKPQFLQGQNAIQSRELIGSVKAVACRRVMPTRAQ
jgi:hypothetical protein